MYLVLYSSRYHCNVYKFRFNDLKGLNMVKLALSICDLCDIQQILHGMLTPLLACILFNRQLQLVNFADLQDSKAIILTSLCEQRRPLGFTMLVLMSSSSQRRLGIDQHRFARIKERIMSYSKKSAISFMVKRMRK